MNKEELKWIDNYCGKIGKEFIKYIETHPNASQFQCFEAGLHSYFNLYHYFR